MKRGIESDGGGGRKKINNEESGRRAWSKERVSRRAKE